MHQSPPLKRPLVLGSTSRYRRELLERLNLPFDVTAPEVDETPLPGEAPRSLALRLALAQARAVAPHPPPAGGIGSDPGADRAGAPKAEMLTADDAATVLRLIPSAFTSPERQAA